MKYCINHNSRPVFAHNRCIYCYRKEILLPKQLAKPKKVYHIKNASPKRVLLNNEYTRVKREKWEQLIKEGKNKCFFSDIWLDSKGPIPDFHHVIGRDGSLLTDKQFMFPVLFNPHRNYHDLKHEYKELEKINWYFPWLERMKKEIPIIYWKEMKSIEKANKTINKWQNNM